MNIGIYIYDNAEVLDFSGPFEVFSTANRFSSHSEKFNVYLIAENEDVVRARNNYQVIPHFSFSNHPEIEVLVVVGGIHCDEMAKENVINWISKTSEKATWVASVCTGAFLLAEAGVLTNHKVTTHWEDIEELRTLYPSLDVVDSTPWVEQGKIITSGGISAGIDMSLHLVSRILSLVLAQKAARQMEFDWRRA